MNLETRSSVAALLLRLGMGVLFIAHGLYLKVFVFGMPGTVGFFQSLGYPGAVAYLTVVLETVGGLALILGLFSRWFALGLLPILAGATLVHVGNGWVFSAPNGGWEYPVFWSVALVALVILGDGRYSLGRVIERRRQRGADTLAPA